MDHITSLTSLTISRIATDVCLCPDALQMMTEICPACPCCVPQTTLDLCDKVLKPAVLSLKIPSALQEQVLSHTLPIALRLMQLVVFHENTFHLYRAEIIRSLEKSVLSCEGLVDHLKLGRKFLEDLDLSATSKYRLSCFYFVQGTSVDNKPSIWNLTFCGLWKSLPTETRDLMETVEKVEMLQIISRYLPHVGINKVKFPQRMLVKFFKAAVECGSLTGVRYCWGNLEQRHRRRLLVTGGLLVLSKMECIGRTCRLGRFTFAQPLAPSDFYIDILWFLVSQMDQDEREKFVRKGRTKPLEYLMRWPHQKRFIQVTESMLKVLEEQDFVYLMAEVLRQLGHKYMKNTNNVVSNSSAEDYRIIFRELWLRSQDRHKRYFFRNGEIQVLSAIIGLDNLTGYDEESFRMIIEDATLDEKHKVFRERGLRICYAASLRRMFSLALWFVKTCCPDRLTLISFAQTMFSSPVINATYRNLVQQMEFADRLLKECFDTEEEISRFKMALPCDSGKYTLFRLIRGDWQTFLDFIHWCLDTDEKLSAFKKQFFTDFSEICNMLFLNGYWLEVEVFLTWIFSTEREIELYKRSTIFPAFAVNTVAYFIERAMFPEAETYVHWLGLSESEIKELKRRIVLSDDRLSTVLMILLSNLIRAEDPEDDPAKQCVKLCGGRLEAVELILRWLLTDEGVTLEFRMQFAECAVYKFQESKGTSPALQAFDHIIEEHLLDLSSQKSTR